MQNEDFEEEDLYGDSYGFVINKPYNPKLVDIIPVPLTMTNLIDRIKYDEIELQPEYQRKGGLWTPTQKSRLIESILINIPLPYFYFDVRNNEKWEVVDGLQRLTSIKEFVYEKELSLCDLEYLTELNGKKYDELPRAYQRKINETNFSTYQIREGTPDDVMMNIFRRINTGGVPLSPGEIRNAVFRGEAATLVKNLANSESFKKATRNRIKPDRMEDRDLVTRFLAFYINGYDSYQGSMDEFLDRVLDFIKRQSKTNEWTKKDSERILNVFNSAMETCFCLFDDKAFRKKSRDNKTGEFTGNFGKLNKAMFECISCCVAKLSESEQKKLCQHKDFVKEKYESIFETDFYKYVNNATGTKERVDGRHIIFANFLKETLEEVC